MTPPTHPPIIPPKGGMHALLLLLLCVRSGFLKALVKLARKLSYRKFIGEISRKTGMKSATNARNNPAIAVMRQCIRNRLTVARILSERGDHEGAKQETCKAQEMACKLQAYLQDVGH